MPQSHREEQTCAARTDRPPSKGGGADLAAVDLLPFGCYRNDYDCLSLSHTTILWF